MNQGTIPPDPGPPVRTQVVHESRRTRITRLFFPERTLICKEPLGPDAQRRLRHEVEMIERLRGADGVAQLVHASPDPRSMVLEDAGASSLRESATPLASDELIELAVCLVRAVSGMHRRGKDGQMRYQTVTDPVYAPNSKGGPQADTERYGQPAGWHTDGDMVRTAYTLRAEDDDWGQAGTLVREVMNEAERDRLVDNVVGHLADGVTESVLQRAFDYWRNVDTDLGNRIEKGVRAG
jgi:hypothetical protein